MMEDFNETLTYSLNDSILSSSSAVASSSSTSSSNTLLDQVTQNQQQQRNDGQNQQQQQPEPGSSVSYRVNISISDSASSDIRDDAWSCVVVVITFWLFASLTLILGLYGSFNLFLSPNYSQLLQVNSIFVQEIRVQPSTIPNEGPVLDGFYRPPSLDVEKIWSEVHTELLPTDFHKEWFYYLNEGSQIDISYVTKSHDAPLILVIAQGKQQLVEWIEDPSYANITLSWNIILGNGSIKLETLKSSDYFVAVGNLNPDPVEVELTFTIRALLYNTTAAYYKCSLNYSVCHFKLTPFGSSAAVLSSPTQNKEGQRNDFYVKISYKPRWTTYFIGSGGMTVLVLLVIKIIAKLQSLMGDESQYEARETSSERAPLILHKDDDASSWGSSYDSASHDDDDGDLEDVLGQSILESTRNVDGDNKNTSNPKRLCVICFDSPRDCFFLPCGHCAACFTCGTRIAEEAGTCPICRRRMKKVRKIFTV